MEVPWREGGSVEFRPAAVAPILCCIVSDMVIAFAVTCVKVSDMLSSCTGKSVKVYECFVKLRIPYMWSVALCYHQCVKRRRLDCWQRPSNHIPGQEPMLLLNLCMPPTPMMPWLQLSGGKLQLC